MKNFVLVLIRSILLLTILEFLCFYFMVDTMLIDMLPFNLDYYYTNVLINCINVIITILYLRIRMNREMKIVRTIKTPHQGKEKLSDGSNFKNDGTYTLLSETQKNTTTTRMYSSLSGRIFHTTQTLVEEKKVTVKNKGLLFSIITIPAALGFSPIIKTIVSYLSVYLPF